LLNSYDFQTITIKIQFIIIVNIVKIVYRFWFMLSDGSPVYPDVGRGLSRPRAVPLFDATEKPFLKNRRSATFLTIWAIFFFQFKYSMILFIAFLLYLIILHRNMNMKNSNFNEKNKL